MKRSIYWLLSILLFINASCTESGRLKAKLKQVVRDNPHNWEQILNILGTEVWLTKSDPKFMQDYCMQLVNAGYYSRALKTSRTLVLKERGDRQYADLYWGILAKNYINPMRDPLFVQYYKDIPDKQKRIFGHIIDSINGINTSLGSAPMQANLHAERGKMLYMLSESAAAEWDLRQCLRYDSSNPDALYNLAFTEFHNNNLKGCWSKLIRYQQTIRERSLVENKGFPAFKNLISQLISYDSLLLQGMDRKGILLKRARLYMDAEEFGLSVKDLDEVLKSDDSNPNLFALRAYANKRMGKDSAAISDLKKAEDLSGKKYPDLDKTIFAK
jgi:hypothetical protein